MNIDLWIEELEETPLLGAGKTRAMDLADQIANAVDPNKRPEVALRLLIRRFKAHPEAAQSAAQLATAEAWAKSEGLDQLASHIQLLWCRQVALTSPEAVPRSILDAAIDAVRDDPSMGAVWRLALAAMEPVKARALREEALDLLPRPAEDKEHIEVHLELASAAAAGADQAQAERHLEQAMLIAEEHKDTKYICRCASRLGLQWLSRGRPDVATPWLQRALAMAQSREDDLQIVIHASLLSAIWLEQGELEKATETADVLLVAGARRGNWFAVVDGHINRSTISMLTGHPTEAIERLVRAVVRLRELIPAAAVNLLKGRLAEIRYQMGSESFDQHYSAAVAANQSH
jgi:tetratricopeptide (TPR) repeat protein